MDIIRFSIDNPVKAAESDAIVKSFRLPCRKDREARLTMQHAIEAFMDDNITIFTMPRFPMPRWLEKMADKVLEYLFAALGLPFLIAVAPLFTLWQMLPETGRATRLHLPSATM